MIHSDQGREFENKVMHELCILGGSHKIKTTPYHPESDGLVERFKRTLLMMLVMFAGEHKDDWDSARIGSCLVPMLGASTVAHTSRDSPSITALPRTRGLCSRMWIPCAMDVPISTTV